MADEPIETPAEETPPAPQYVTREDFDRERAAITTQWETLNATLAGIRDMVASSRTNPVPASVSPAPANELTTQQYVEAVQNGDVATIDAYNAQQQRKYTAEHVDPLRAFGTSALSNLTKSQVIATLPYYKRYQKEIDAHMATLTPEMRSNPDSYRIAHDVVVGAHINELTDETREATLRQQNAPKAETQPANTRTGRTQESGRIPTPFDLGGRDSEVAMEEVGKDQETLAKKLGYASWNDYMTKCAEYIVR